MKDTTNLINIVTESELELLAVRTYLKSINESLTIKRATLESLNLNDFILVLEHPDILSALPIGHKFKNLYILESQTSPTDIPDHLTKHMVDCKKVTSILSE